MEAVIQSAVSAASSDYVNFQAVIKSAASGASLDLQESLAGPAVRMPSHRLLASLQIQGGCASSRLDHGCPKIVKK